MSADKRALLPGLSAVLLWSTVATALKLALREMDVFQLLFYAIHSATLVGLGLIIPDVLIQQVQRPIAKGWG